MSLEIISWKQFEEERRQNPGVIVDLRSLDCYHLEHVAGAVSLPYSEWEEHWPRLSKHVPIYLYCDRGNAALAAGRALTKEGYRAIAVMGGYPNPCDFG